MAFIQWILAHQVICAAAAVGLLDFLFALIPSLDSNGILHWVYLTLKSLIVKDPPALK